MCGICGVYNFGSGAPVSKAVVKAMADTLIHRGPNDEGFFLSGPVGLGHRRLSIIDIEGGHQPMANHDGSLWVVFNGEIYNFQELRNGLTAKGYTFKTRSDTEVLLCLYQEYGEACFEQLRGMFAMVVWDSKKRQMVLARDRVGKKPLFYYLDKSRIVFASELKAILQVPGIPRDLNPEAVADYFSLLYVPAPKSILRGISKVKPGYYCVVSEKGIREVQYWDMTFASTVVRSEAEWCEQLLESYREAVRIRLISDVPLGAFLSGGVDSSSVVALMAELTGAPVITTSIGFEEKSFDELEYARLVSRQFNTKHHEQIVESDAGSLLEKLAWHYDEPFGDSSALPTYYVSQVARQHVTVALSGDGGDESFAGYRRYYFDQRAYRTKQFFPASLRSLLFGGIASWYTKVGLFGRWGRGRATFENLSLSHIDGYFRMISAWQPDLKTRLLHGDIKKQLGDYDTQNLFRAYYNNAGTDDPLSRIQYVDIKTYLPDDILVKVDRASMANSLEVRAPLLDHKFMEIVATIPSSLKLRGKIGKYILKKAFAGRLPDDILHRPKMGFAVPVAHWLRTDLKRFAERLLFSVSDDGILDHRIIRQLWDEHQECRGDRSTELWTILMFRLWQSVIACTPVPNNSN